jgi:hypothetical protein
MCALTRAWILIFLLISPAYADEMKDGLGPAIPRATGKPHPEGNAYMRRWHMTMMRHDRDLTMYNGDRDINASIGECFECHAVLDDGGKPVTFADSRHFCRTCHDYAAVKIDCFDCHRSTPAGFEEPASHAAISDAIKPLLPNAEQLGSLRAYLDTLARTEVRK